jgi:hypothetical protein
MLAQNQLQLIIEDLQPSTPSFIYKAILNCTSLQGIEEA